MPKHQRLRSARVRAGFKTAREAAARLNVPYGTYSGHESGSRGIKEDEIKKYAAFFNVSASWLLFGQEDVAARFNKFVIVNGHFGKSSDGKIEFLSNSQIELMPVDIQAIIRDNHGNSFERKMTLPMPFYMAPAIDAFDRLVVIKVSGEKLAKDWENGSVLYFQTEKYEDIKGFSRSNCICYLNDGTAVIARPLAPNISGKAIVSVSPLVLHLSRVGQTLWLEALAATFMHAAQSDEI